MATVKAIIEEKNARLNSVPDEFLTQVERVQQKIFVELLSLVNTLEQKNGSFTTTAKNLSRVALLIEDLRETLAGGEYPVIVQSFIDEFATQKFLSDSYFEQSFPDFSRSPFADAILKKSQADARQALLGSPVDSKFLQPIETILTDSISTGATWKDTVLSIREFVEGSEGVDGRLLRHAKGISHDKFAFSDRAYSSAVADELGNDWFLLSGSIIETSRCVCIKFHEQYFHRKEIQAFARGEGLGDCKVGDLWAGAVPETNESTIFIYAMGFGCRHNWLPVSVFSVPKNVIVRNLENGNYEPGRAEREAVGV